MLKSTVSDWDWDWIHVFIYWLQDSIQVSGLTHFLQIVKM